MTDEERPREEREGSRNAGEDRNKEGMKGKTKG